MVVPLCHCRVTVTDTQGQTHSTEVTAERLYEACALALRIFREQGFADDNGAFEFDVEVKPPAARHKVRGSRVLLWL